MSLLLILQVGHFVYAQDIFNVFKSREGRNAIFAKTLMHCFFFNVTVGFILLFGSTANFGSSLSCINVNSIRAMDTARYKLIDSK